MSKLINKLAVFIIKIYQAVISPLFPSSCRFYPSCSNYGVMAYKKFGFLKASLLTIKRVGKCHPFHPGGYDPLPTCKEDHYG